MVKIMKKISPKTKTHLKFLVENFFEVNLSTIKKSLRNSQTTENYWNMIETILFSNGFEMDEVDPEDMGNSDKAKLICYFHKTLKPLWDQFKAALIEYKNKIVPMRMDVSTLIEDIGNNRTAEYIEYKDLLKQSDILSRETFYDISFDLKVSFDPGHVTFYKRNINIVNNLLGIFNEIPISLLSQCNYCGNFIVLTRSDKQYCTGCASRKYQNTLWKNDPDGMRQKERIRYRTKRRRSNESP